MESNNLKVASLNIRSIRKNFDSLNLVLAGTDEYDLLVLSETWINSEEAPRYVITGYDFHLHERLSRRSGGVGVYVKHNLSYEIEKVGGKSFNGLRLKLLKNNDREEVVILAVYRNQDYESTKQFLDELNCVLSSIDKKDLIVLGDMNIDILSDSELSIDYLNLMSAFGLKAVHKLVTRQTESSGTCIDHVFYRKCNSSCVNNIKNCSVQDLSFSDHKLVKFEICHGEKRDGNTSKCTKRKSPNFIEDIDFNQLNVQLQNTDWNLLKNGSVHCAFSRFVGILGDAVRASTKIQYINSKMRRRNPWASRALIKMAAEKEKYYALCRRHPQSQALREKYRNFRKRVVEKSRDDKLSYYSNQLDTAKTDPKRYWGIIKNLLGTKAKKGIEKIRIDEQEMRVEGNACKVANSFNEYFSTISDTLLENLKYPRQNHRADDSADSFVEESHQEFKIDSITVGEIIWAIAALPNKRGSGLDGINSKIYKMAVDALATPLVILFNRSLNEGIFPNSLKTSIVVPVYKGGDPTELNNYRPISILQTLSKIFEKIVAKRLRKYLDCSKFFSEKQFGFRPGRNIDQAVMQHVTEIVGEIEGSKTVAAIYLDIRKAFDTVNHQILLSKLQNCGVRGTLLSWFTSYLTDRKQCVKIDKTCSRMVTIHNGVPQGSTLGPLLFIIYVNDLLKMTLQGSIYSFADDTALIYSSFSLVGLEKKIEEDMVQLKNWFDSHKIVPNIGKTKLILFNYKENKKLKKIKTIKWDGIPIEQVSQTKYLGLIIDSKLTWSNHLIEMKKRTQKLNGMLYYLSKFFKRKHLKRIYQTLVQPIYRFGIIHWGNAADYRLRGVVTSQKYAIRIITGSKRNEETGKKFGELEILKLKELYQYEIARYGLINHKNFGIVLNAQRVRRKGPIIIKFPRWLHVHSCIQGNYMVRKVLNTLSDTVWIREDPTPLNQKTISRYLKLLKVHFFARYNA